jgi:hypothetical protein
MMLRRSFILSVLLGSAVSFGQTLTVSFKTTSHNGRYSPDNIVAVWVETSNGTFVRTIGRWAGQRASDLRGWVGAAGAGDFDAIAGATRSGHSDTLTRTWNMRAKTGALVADGSYRLRMELCDNSVSSAAGNDQGTFTFVKGPNSQTQQNLTSGGFHNVTITYTAPTSGTGGGGGSTGGGSGATGGGSAATGGGTAATGGGTAATGGGTAATGGGTAATGGGTAATGGGSAATGGSTGTTGGGTGSTGGGNSAADAGAGGGNVSTEMGCSTTSVSTSALWLLALGAVLLARLRS